MQNLDSDSLKYLILEGYCFDLDVHKSTVKSVPCPTSATSEAKEKTASQDDVPLSSVIEGREERKKEAQEPLETRPDTRTHSLRLPIKSSGRSVLPPSPSCLPDPTESCLVRTFLTSPFHRTQKMNLYLHSREPVPIDTPTTDVVVNLNKRNNKNKMHGVNRNTLNN